MLNGQLLVELPVLVFRRHGDHVLVGAALPFLDWRLSSGGLLAGWRPPMLTVSVDQAAVERSLRAGELGCPCGGVLVPWGSARPRSMRGLGSTVRVRPRRGGSGRGLRPDLGRHDVCEGIVKVGAMHA